MRGQQILLLRHIKDDEEFPVLQKPDSQDE